MLQNSCDEGIAANFYFFCNIAIVAGFFCLLNVVFLPSKAVKILNEIHSGDCGHHVGSRSLVTKAFRHGFYWLIAHTDAEDIVGKYDGCQ